MPYVLKMTPAESGVWGTFLRLFSTKEYPFLTLQVMSFPKIHKLEVGYFLQGWPPFFGRIPWLYLAQFCKTSFSHFCCFKFPQNVFWEEQQIRKFCKISMSFPDSAQIICWISAIVEFNLLNLQNFSAIWEILWISAKFFGRSREKKRKKRKTYFEKSWKISDL